MSTKPEQMSRAELVAALHSLEARLRDDAERRALVHELQVHQEELEAQNDQLIEMQQALESARDRYVDLFEFAPVAYVMLDVVGCIEAVNGAAHELLGAADRLRLTRTPFLVFVAEEDRRLFRAHLALMRGGSEHSQTEVRLRIPGRSQDRVVQVYSRQLKNRDTGDAHYLSSLIDVTAQRQAEEDRRIAEMARRTLVEEEHAMRAAGEAKDRFLAALSHELRTPLTPIVLALDALVQRGDIPPSVEPTLRMVRRNVEQEARLIDDLLDVTRIAHDKLRCESAIVDVHALLRDLHGAFGHEAGESEIELTLDLAADEAHVMGDSVRLKQVVSNLLRNAIRHTERGGRISLSSSTPTRHFVRIRVVDTGSGIPATSLERIFVPFEQVDRVHGVGLGLGLAIAKGLVEQHGGRISAASEGPGKGSTFTVELPTVPAPVEDHDIDASAVPDRSTRETTVLLVEDHHDSAEALELGLSSAGYNVIVADSIRAALARADGEFDVLVSDLSLPDGSGLDVIRALLSRRPIIGIVLSGFGSPRDVEASLAAGFQRHLVKPVDLRMLVDTIEALLRPLASPRTA